MDTMKTIEFYDDKGVELNEILEKADTVVIDGKNVSFTPMQQLRKFRVMVYVLVFVPIIFLFITMGVVR